MNKININTSVQQECTCEELDAIAHDYFGIQQSLDDESYGCRATDNITLPDKIKATDGVYSDTKEAFVKAGVDEVSGTEYVRVLDPLAISFLKSISAPSIDGEHYTKANLAATSLYSYCNVGAKVKDFSIFQYMTQYSTLNQSAIFRLNSGSYILEEIRFPPTMTYFGCFENREGLNGCSTLKVVGINSAILFGDSGNNGCFFYGCSNVKKIIVDTMAHWFGCRFEGHNPDKVTGYYSNPAYGGKASLYLTSDESTPLGTESNPLVIPSSVTAFNDYALYNLKSLNYISYEGTVEQYKAITRGTSWHTNVPCTTIVCSDGTCGIDDVAS